MITRNIKQYIIAGCLCCGAVAALTACTDTWDEHYDSLGGGTVHDGTLWQAIKSNPDLSNFSKVIEGCDFAKSLDGSQVFTVFAPTNDKFSAAEADALVSEYNKEKADGVTEEDNTVIKEFIQNHVALYNYSVNNTSTDTIMLMNGKYAVLNGNSIEGVNLLSKNQLYGNGVLYTLGDKVGFLSNLFEYMRKDPDLDSLRSFFYSSHFYYKDFMPERSVPGSIVDGKTQYLDSVFVQRNELFDLLDAELDSEDSTYIMVVPTNDAWAKMVEEYEPYFNYPKGVEDRDSMVYTNTRLAMLSGTAFSRTFNSDKTLNDSAMSTMCIRDYAMRRSYWGVPFEYYEYRKPLMPPYGVLSQDEADIVQCSNGQLQKASQWNIDKLMGFHQYIIVEAEGGNSIKEVSKIKDTHGDSITTVSPVARTVTSDNSYYNKVWNNGFVEFVPDIPTTNHSVTFNLRNVLSNVGYDIYLVMAPALANDSNATQAQRLPTIVQCSITTPGGSKTELINMADPKGGKTFTTKVDSVDYIMLAKDFKFDVCTRGISDVNMQATLKVETRVSNSQLRTNSYTRTMRIDCILLVPHNMLEVVDALPNDPSIPSYMVGTPGVLMYPHGRFEDRPFKWWYMQR